MVGQRRGKRGAQTLAFLVVTLLAVLAVACGEEEKTPTAAPPATATSTGTGTATSTPPATATPGDQAPADQQVITVQSTEPQFYDPHRSNFAQDITIARMVWRGLYQLNPETAAPEPAMAADMPQLSGNVYTVKLKDGLTWSDGQPLTAADFEYGIKAGCDAEFASPYQYVLATGYAGIVGCNELFTAFGTEEAPLTPTDAELAALRDAVGVKATDATTLTITVEKPTATFATVMALWVAFPLRQDIYEQFGDKWTDPGNLVANGPFIITELVPKDHLTLEPNPNWALEPKPALQKITVKFIDDFQAAFRAFQAGDLDMAQIDAGSVPVAQADEGLAKQLQIVGSGRIDTIETQLKDPALAKFEVRLALSQAMDREAINKVVYNGANIPALYWVVKGIPGYVGNDEYADIDYNPEQAKANLAAAGYPNGEGFPKLKLTLRDDATQKALGEFLQKQWKDTLGIDVELDIVDAKTRSAKFNSKEFQLFRGGWQIDYPDPENVIGGLFDTGGGNNKYDCSDPEIDAKIEEAFNATTEEARIAAWTEAGKLVVHKLCGVIPFAQLGQPYMVAPKMGGVIANGALDASLPGDTAAEFWFVKAGS